MKGKAGPAAIARACVDSFSRRGWAARFSSIARLDALEEDILAFRRSGALAPCHFDHLMGCWDFKAARAFPGAASLIVAACPSPPRRLAFVVAGKRVEVVLPPVFAERGLFESGALAALEAVLGPAGYRAVSIDVPEKFLAARSGLARIGRNRISYVDGMGSFLRLAAFASDCPLPEDAWGDVQRPDTCASCGACERACPTGALTDDGRPLPYERCLCHWNEEAEGPFPDWIDASWHNAAIGCMRCQASCPLNAPYIRTEADGPSFTETETALILSATPSDSLPPSLKEKLSICGLLHHRSALPRNLHALFSRPT